jgi:hypothetical protein
VHALVGHPIPLREPLYRYAVYLSWEGLGRACVD